MTVNRIDSESVFDEPGSQPGLRQRMKSEARRVASQHRQLRTFFEEVMSAFRSDSRAEAERAYGRFRNALEAHLRLEDEVFFPALNGLDPELGRELTSLAREHNAFRDKLGQLQGDLAAGSGDRFVPDFEGLAAEIMDHEQREEQLLSRISPPAA